MRASRILLKHTPMIRFLGKRGLPKEIDHAPHAHPASPTHTLPDSFASYRKTAQQYGPIKGDKGSSSSSTSSNMTTSAAPPPSRSTGQTGGLKSDRSGKSLGSVEPKQGEYFDRSELPARFRRGRWEAADMDMVNSGGASRFG